MVYIVINLQEINFTVKCPHNYTGNSQSFSQNRSSITVTAILYFTSISTFSVDWLKACQYLFPQHQPFLLSLAWICHDRKQALPKNRLIAYPYLQSLQNTEILLLFKILNYELNSVTSEEYLFVRFFISSSLTP